MNVKVKNQKKFKVLALSIVFLCVLSACCTINVKAVASVSGSLDLVDADSNSLPSAVAYGTRIYALVVGSNYPDGYNYPYTFNIYINDQSFANYTISNYFVFPRIDNSPLMINGTNTITANITDASSSVKNVSDTIIVYENTTMLATLSLLSTEGASLINADAADENDLVLAHCELVNGTATYSYDITVAGRIVYSSTSTSATIEAQIQDYLAIGDNTVSIYVVDAMGRTANSTDTITIIKAEISITPEEYNALFVDGFWLILSVIVPLLIIFGCGLIGNKLGKTWGFFTGLNIGAIVTYVCLPAYLPIWGLVLVVLMDVLLLYGKVRG